MKRLSFALAMLPLALPAVLSPLACDVPPGAAPDEAVAEREGAQTLCLGRPCTTAPIQVPINPVPITLTLFPGPTDFVDITAGSSHTCARRHDGNLYCWGRDDLGQAGISATKTCASGSGCVDKPMLTMTGATAVDAGLDHTCALDTAGHASCWGSSSSGQIGDGVYGSTTQPIAVSPPAGAPGPLVFTTISAGGNSTCGTTAGGIYCWGGIGGGLAAYAPSVVPISVGGWFTYLATKVSVGAEHACAYYPYAYANQYDVDCWGMNQNGQAGSDPHTYPFVVLDGGTQLGTQVSRAATQNDFTCADQMNGTVQCFGDGYWGQLGNGTSGATASTYVPSIVGQTAGVAQALSRVVTGVVHACALDPSGAAWCWGNGYSGQLGNNSANPSSIPVAVAGGHTFRALAAGWYHTCGVGNDNHLWCWGSNSDGQLGTQYPGGWVSSPVQAIDPS